jgi:hypothetical protein
MPFISSIGISALNIIRGGAAGEAGTLLLDLYPNAAAAYSLRKLKTDYIGDAIRVRESGGAEADIGFDANGNLDTAALLAHCGGNDGFVTRWYDQSGNSEDVTQSTLGNQPRIVNSGVLETYLGKPSLLGISGTNSLISENKFNIAGANGEFSIFTTFESYLPSTTVYLYRVVNPNVAALAVLSAGTNFRLQTFNNIGGNNLLSSSTAINNSYVMSNIRTTDSAFTELNNETETSITGLAIGESIDATVSIMGQGAFGHQGYFSEFIAYPSDQSANKDAIKSNINAYYNIY